MLRIACADVWPGLREECKRAVSPMRPANMVGAVQSDGCSFVVCSSRHWPCLLPQHGPGKKQDRVIELQPWQRVITGRHWRYSRRNTISVARREAVARLDQFVGPKY